MYNLNVQIYVNTMKDSVKIRELFYGNMHTSSLAITHPQIASEWNQDRNGTITPKMVSYGSHVKFWWKCSVCSNEWKTAVCDRTTGKKGCPICAKKFLSLRYRKSNESFIQELSVINPNLMPLEEYQTTHFKILIRCLVCGYEWFASPANLLRGRDCPKCSKRRSAKKCSIKKLEQSKKKKTEG